MLVFHSLWEVTVRFWFGFTTALYNEKVGVNERKRKRRTTIR